MPIAVVRTRYVTALPLTLAVGALLAMTGCGNGGDHSSAVAGAGTMIIAAPNEPSTLFPPRVSDGHELMVASQIFDRLAEIKPTLGTSGDADFVPRLAASWQWAPDSLSIAFALDPRARWHDGAPLRADDVRYSFHVYTSPVVASEQRSLLGNIDSVTVRDSLTAVFWFKRRTPQQFMDATFPLLILPSHLLASLPDSALANAPFGRAPVGTGRFRFVKWDAGSRLELQSDTSNFRGRAVLDRVIFSFVGDAGAAIVKLVAGEADVLDGVRPENVAQITAAPQLRLVTNLPLQYNFVSFNLNQRRSPAGGGAPHPVFGDVRVRRALAMALDREKMVRTVFDSLGMVAFTAAPRVLIPDTSALKPITYNLTAAQALLDSAGWTDANRDGVRERDGQPLTFELLTSSTRTRKQMAELLQAAFKDVGADVKILALDGPAASPRLESRNYDACVCGWFPNPGNQGMRQTWMSRGTSNSVGYANPVFDANVDSALTTFDVNKAKTYWTRAFQLIIDDAPAIWLWEQRLPIAVHKRIRVAPMRADAWYANLADWSVDPALRIDRDKLVSRSAR